MVEMQLPWGDHFLPFLAFDDLPALAADFFLAFLPSKAAAQPAAYFLVVPTRMIDTVVFLVSEKGEFVSRARCTARLASLHN